MRHGVAPADSVAVIGLGYVGIQLATALGRERPTIGFDQDESKLDEYRLGHDPSGELGAGAFNDATQLSFTSDPGTLGGASIAIVAVPTPVDKGNRPDLSYLASASETLGRVMQPGVIVIYESTVYPGATEEVCIPALERSSGLKWKKDFHVGYSPERINPGDPEHGLTQITKLISADDEITLAKLETLYRSIIPAGIRRVSSIRVAEAAKVIENTQRDLNIALVNEIAMILDRLEIDSTEVFEAAETKWNFHRFRPGLVGGHCIGVDPYYLTYKAQAIGYQPEVILAGRRINDEMATFVAKKTIDELQQSGATLSAAPVTVLGVAFKENCADTRNSQVFKLITTLQETGICVQVVDPIVDAVEVTAQHGVCLHSLAQVETADALVIAVAHETFLVDPEAMVTMALKEKGVLIDVKSAFNSIKNMEMIGRYWSL